MSAVIGLTVLILVVVGLVLAFVGEFSKDVAKSAITLVVLSAITGYVAALASGSI